MAGKFFIFSQSHTKSPSLQSRLVTRGAAYVVPGEEKKKPFWGLQVIAMFGADLCFQKMRKKEATINPNSQVSRTFSKLLSICKGIVTSGITYYVQGNVMKTRGLVLVTVFNPLTMIFVILFASFILAEKLHLGSIFGGIIIVIGLYFVIWCKSKDYASPEIFTTNEKGDRAQALPMTIINVATTV